MSDSSGNCRHLFPCRSRAHSPGMSIPMPALLLAGAAGKGHLGKEDRAQSLLHPALAYPTRAGHMGPVGALWRWAFASYYAKFQVSHQKDKISQGYESHIVTPIHTMRAGWELQKQRGEDIPTPEQYQSSFLDIHSSFTPPHSRISHGVYQLLLQAEQSKSSQPLLTQLSLQSIHHACGPPSDVV